ncbi:NAD(P)/FAD-dependent oxidoreductase [Wenxinia saemankumensis]|uniref:Glycine/D-amino acid oxidase n=1 Tax=Wenxinia saemankumensis TaxID=1447782 RepID=A0A1M6FJT1_9RHOB|nr:FAD-dependent oxidoreductase [Wenxinia saemankumensis]SHI97947.1 Glycine/D-amino acid oxidase [Wenxinia saemankumensis]
MSDFLVIGGGIAGISAGARLSALGSVTVLEREGALAYHASGRSAALYERNYGRPATIALNEASYDHLRHEGGGVLSPRGIMVIGKEADRAAFDADMAAMRLAPLGPGEARALFPLLAPEVTLAAHDPEAWDIDTDRLVQDFARAIRGAGGRIVTGAEVTSIRRTGTGWVVEAGETVEARLLIDAAGAWADGIAAMAGIAPLGLVPHRRSMARVPAPEGMDPAGWPMVMGPGEDWYMKPDAGALIVSPAEEDPAEPHDAYPDDMVLAEGLARFEAYTTYETRRMLSNWAGLRTFAPDRTLVLGPDPADPSFLWCAGQGGYGFQSAAAASTFLADLVGGRPSVLPAEVQAALRPDRLR